MGKPRNDLKGIRNILQNTVLVKKKDKGNTYNEVDVMKTSLFRNAFPMQDSRCWCKDAAEKGLFDLYLAKYWGLKFATTAACTVLKVDQAQGAGVTDAAEKGLFDLYLAKYWGLKFATAAACTVLKVDQIIMARAAGGPKARGPGARDEDD